MMMDQKLTVRVRVVCGWGGVCRPPPPYGVCGCACSSSSLSSSSGVCWDAKAGKWKAQISQDGKNKHLGSYDIEHEAAKAFDK